MENNQNKHNVTGLNESTLSSLRGLVDTNAIIGQPITLPDGTTIIPVSKISFGYGTGGSDIPSQKTGQFFGGGTGGGGSVEPIAFILITGGEIRLMEISTADNSTDRMVNMVPQIFDKITAFVDSRSERKRGEQRIRRDTQTGKPIPEEAPDISPDEGGQDIY